MKTPFTLAALLLLVACPPSATHPAPDADAASTPSCITMCANLATLGCSEGLPATGCEQACTRATGAFYDDVTIKCIAGAPSKQGVRACGRVACP